MKIRKDGLLYRFLKFFHSRVATDSCTLIAQIGFAVFMSLFCVAVGIGMVAGFFVATGNIIGILAGATVMGIFDSEYVWTCFALLACLFALWLATGIYTAQKYEYVFGMDTIESAYKTITKKREINLGFALIRSFFGRFCFKIEHV